MCLATGETSSGPRGSKTEEEVMCSCEFRIADFFLVIPIILTAVFHTRPPLGHSVPRAFSSPRYIYCKSLFMGE